LVLSARGDGSCISEIKRRVQKQGSWGVVVDQTW